MSDETRTVTDALDTFQGRVLGALNGTDKRGYVASEIDRFRAALRGTATQADGGEARLADIVDRCRQHIAGLGADLSTIKARTATSTQRDEAADRAYAHLKGIDDVLTSALVAQADTAPGGGPPVRQLLVKAKAALMFQHDEAEASAYAALAAYLQSTSTDQPVAAPPDPIRLARAMERVPADEFKLARLTDSETLAESIVKRWDGAARERQGGGS